MSSYLVVLQEVEDKLDDDIIFKPQQLGDPLSDPGLDGVQADLAHVHLRVWG